MIRTNDAFKAALAAEVKDLNQHMRRPVTPPKTTAKQRDAVQREAERVAQRTKAGK